MATDEWVVIRLKMQDTAKFIADAKAAGASIQHLDRQTKQLGTTMRTSGRHGFWFNQMMFTLRRQVYGVSLGLGVLGVAAGVMGFKFDIAMDSAKMAFTRFLGGPQEAQKEIDYLFELAAKTPFEFPQLANAARKFLAFGYSVDEANSTLEVLSDAVAAFGGGAPEIERGVLALGQMRSAGRVLGQDLRQLQELGLFSPEDFARRLHLPQGFLGHVGQLGIPSKQGIDAITAYWREKFGGASEDFAKTFMGRITTLRDYAGRMFGAMVQPLKDRLTNEIFPLLINAFKDAGKAFETGGMTAALESIDKNLNKGTDLAGVWTYLTQVVQNFYRSLWILWQALWNAWSMAKGNVIVFGSLYIVFWSIYQVLNILQPVLEYMIFLWLVDRFAIIAVTLATKGKVFWDAIEVAWQRRKLWFMRIIYFWRLREVYLYLWQTRVMKLVAFWEGIVAVATWAWAAATTGLAAAMWLTGIPEFIIIVAMLIGLIAAAIIWWDDWTAALGRAKTRVDELLDSLGPLRGALSGLSYIFPPLKYGAVAIEKFQFGGTMPFPGGPALVGEGGPEMLYLPGGARVEPIAAAMQSRMSALGGTGQHGQDIVINNKIFLDGRQISESVARHSLDAEARR